MNKKKGERVKRMVSVPPAPTGRVKGEEDEEGSFFFSYSSLIPHPSALKIL
jgi:hypothetical protein